MICKLLGHKLYVFVQATPVTSLEKGSVLAMCARCNAHGVYLAKSGTRRGVFVLGFDSVLGISD